MKVDQQGFAIVDRAYRDLLKLSPSEPFRIFNQALYASLRDAIAWYRGEDPESVQNRYEGVESSWTQQEYRRFTSSK